MKKTHLILIMSFLVIGLFLTVGFNRLVSTYINSLSHHHDVLIGTWEITWDKDAEDESTYVIRLDKLALRQFYFYIQDDNMVTFIDDEGCYHVGKLRSNNSSAYGLYSDCPKYPDWIGNWEAEKISE